MDMAKMGFFQFLRSEHGSDLLDMLFLAGQPTPALWAEYTTWWGNSKQELDAKLAKVRLGSYVDLSFNKFYC